MNWNHVDHDSLTWQRVENALEMAHVLDTKRHNVEHIIKEEQFHRAHVAALSQMQLQAMQKGEEQKRSCEGSVLC